MSSDKDSSSEPTRWTVHGERLVDDTRRLRLSVAQVELPDGVHFEQSLLRMPQAAMTDAAQRYPGARTADLVGLTADLLGRRAHEVSDGQLQRACLARALALNPSYLVCDEMTTMLDASTTAALVAVIRDYQRQVSAGVFAISHDTVLLERWADHVVTPDS